MYFHNFILLLMLSFPTFSMDRAIPEHEPKPGFKSDLYKILEEQDKKERIKIGKKKLLEGIRFNNFNKVKAVMSTDVSEFIQKSSKKDFLAIAFKKNADEKIIELLINNHPQLKFARKHFRNKIIELDFNIIKIFLKSQIGQEIIATQHSALYAPLAVAIKTNNKNMVELLIKSGALINKIIFENYEGFILERSYLGLALQNKKIHGDILKLLFEMKACLNPKTEKSLNRRYEKKQKEYHEEKNRLLIRQII